MNRLVGLALALTAGSLVAAVPEAPAPEDCAGLARSRGRCGGLAMTRLAGLALALTAGSLVVVEPCTPGPAGQAVLSLGPQWQTLWYEVVVQ